VTGNNVQHSLLGELLHSTKFERGFFDREAYTGRSNLASYSMAP